MRHLHFPVLLIVLFIAACTTTEETTDPALLSTNTDVTLRLTWLPGGVHLNFFAALHKGYYAEEGLNVSIQAASHPSDSIRLVGSGQDEIGIAYMPDVLIAAEQNINLVSFYAILQEHNLGIISLNNNLQQISDFPGKTFGIVGTPIDQTMFGTMINNIGLAEDDLTIIDPGFSGLSQLTAGTVDAISGLPWFEGVILDQQDQQYTFFPYMHYGSPNFYFYVLIANQDFAKNNPDILQRFVRATIRGTRFAEENPEESIDFLLSDYPDLDHDIELGIWLGMTELIHSADTEEYGIGYQSEIVWLNIFHFLEENEVISGDIDVNQLYTNDFIQNLE